MAAVGAHDPRTRTWSWIATGALALVAAVGGPIWTPAMVDAGAFFAAVGVSALAQIAALKYRQGNRVVFFAWGEAALIIVVYQVPLGYVPVVIGAGALVGRVVRNAFTRTDWTWAHVVGVADIALAGTAGALVAHLGLPGRLDRVTPGMIAALAAGALAYSLVGAALLTFNLLNGPETVANGTLRVFLDKMPMTGGNITIGIIVVVLAITDRIWLVLMPPVLVLMHQSYLYRSRHADERRIWRDFAGVTRSFNQLDERGVAVAAVEGTLRLFDAHTAEVWVDRLAGSARGYRGRANGKAIEVTQLSGGTGARSDLPGARRALSIGGISVGELRLWLGPGQLLDGRDEMALTALAEALAVALHDASANRALRTLTERSVHDAQHDVLTGVSNRGTLLREGARALDAAAPGDVYSLHMVGINRFKEVNDTLGPLAGDELLRVTAGRLSATTASGELLARVGGDEFAVLSRLGGQDDGGGPWARYETAAAERAAAFAAALAVPTTIGKLPVAVEVSVGVVVATAAECDIAELVRRADIAMHRAKRGAGPVSVFDGNDPAPVSVEGLSVLVDLREALDRDDQLVLAVQPAVDLASRRPVSAEALVRWRHPRRGLLGPADFVDTVDRSDLVVPFTRYVLDRALHLAGEWAAAGLSVPVSVNLSPRSLADATLPDDVANLLKTHRVEPGMLILEITESAVATGQPIVSRVLAELRTLGVQLAVDDFGSGYSSLTFLTLVQVDEVKIDSGFVARMTASVEAHAIVRTTIDLGRNLGVRVVAEGVETAAQCFALTELGCRAAQGHHLAVPVDAVDSAALLADLIDRAR